MQHVRYKFDNGIVTSITDTGEEIPVTCGHFIPAYLGSISVCPTCYQAMQREQALKDRVAELEAQVKALQGNK